jgi:hypothetical protein
MPRRSNWDDRADDFDRWPVMTTLKWGIIVIIVCAIFAALIGLITTGSVFFEGQAAKITNPSRVQKKVYDPNNTIAQIAFFHDTCNRVRTGFAQWQSAGEKVSLDVQGTHSSDPIKAQQAQNALDQDTQALIGTQQNIYATANDYNSRSAQSTANVFKDNNLPSRIEPPVNVGDLKRWSPPSCG